MKITFLFKVAIHFSSFMHFSGVLFIWLYVYPASSNPCRFRFALIFDQNLNPDFVELLFLSKTKSDLRRHVFDLTIFGASY